MLTASQDEKSLIKRHYKKEIFTWESNVYPHVNNSIKGFLKDVRTCQSPIGKSKHSKCNDDAKDTTSYLLNQNKTDN